jgi:hypothetical protein
METWLSGEESGHGSDGLFIAMEAGSRMIQGG